MTKPQRFTLAIAVCASALIARSSAIAVSRSGLHAGGADGYDVAVEVSEAGGGATWTYTITKTSDAAKDVGHFILNFDTCGGQSPTIASIVSATVDGVNWLDHIEATDGVTGCGVPSPNFVKFDDLPDADTHVIQFTLDDVYPLMDSTAWLKSGKTCLKKALLGPGCKGYLRTSTMEAEPSLAGKPYSGINSYMRRFGFDYTEHPNCTGGYGGHMDGVHGDVEADPSAEQTGVSLRYPHRSGHRRRSLQLEHRGPPAQRDEVDHQQLDVGEGPGQLGRVADPGMEVQASRRDCSPPPISFISTN